MLRYHYARPACSLVGMIAIEASGARYEPVLVDLASDRSELRAINPTGKVPTLQADELVVTDTVAIVHWLARRYPDAGLLPADPDAMSLALSKMAWFGSVLHILRRQYTRPMMFCDGVEAQAEVKAVATPRYWAGLEQVNDWIGTGELGDPAASLGVEAYALLFYHWGMMDRQPVETLPHYAALARRLAGREGVSRALARHGSPLLG